jgi:hypothetical protein
MRDYQYVWLLWSGAFLAPWALLYFLWQGLRPHILRVSAATSLLGLTEPIFVPRYWNPPSLFDLAQRTGFDVESFIFCFAIGGIGSALYNALARRDFRRVPDAERHSARHRFHALALVTPYLSFPPLYALPWNPIYPGIVALAIGAASTVACRPELARKALFGGLLFLALYAAFMVLLVVFAPGYIERVWNLADLSGLLLAGIPMEELVFGFAFGMYWSGLYEHFSWRAIGSARTTSGLNSHGAHHHG